ncbi:hypothetical protein EV363DRAFT_630127 [Boletus edulis]|nr:hypothetical protein EV363DRAFT_630127 [Boletus edulis]
MNWNGFSVGYGQTALILRIARMCEAAGSVVVLYDHVLTFDLEVDHIWNHLFNFGSLNYIMIRYIGDALAILNMIAFLRGPATQKVCEVYFLIQTSFGILELFLIQLTLQTRVYALYQGSKKILALIIFGYGCEIAAMLTISGYLYSDLAITNEILPGLYICADTQAPSFYEPYVIWLPVIVYDGILCLLALWHGIRTWMSDRTKRLDGVYIADVLIKDNVGYFLCILLTCIVSVVIAQCLGLRWKEVSEEFPAPMEVVIGCRLILNLRSAFVRDTEQNHSDDAPWVVRRLPSCSC